MVEFDGIYSMLFTGSFEVGHGFVTAAQSGIRRHKVVRNEAGSTYAKLLRRL